VDLGGTKIQTVVVDGDHEVVGQARVATPTEGGPPDVAAAIAGAVRDAAGDAGIEPAELRGVGVGSPGAVDAGAGTVSGAGNLPDWHGTFALGPELEGELGVPVKLGNDVEVATDAEFRLGSGKPHDSMLGVFWGTGVGGGIVLDKKLWQGRGAAGEIGHVVVVQDGEECPCGRRGCMEAYAGRKALEMRARKRVDEGAKTDLFKIMKKRERTRLTAGIWSRALEHGDELAKELIDDAVEAIGTAVASTINILDVEAVIIGGGLGVKLGEPYRERIEAAMMPHLFVDHRPPEVLMVELGDLGGAIGAALLAPRPRGRSSRKAKTPSS
jgi:glucokinase